MRAPRAAALALATICAVASAAVAGTGSGPAGMGRAALFLACLFIAVVVVLLPQSLRARMGLFVAAFVAAVGVVAVFVQPADAPTSAPTDVPRANPQYLADLVMRGPFGEKLPQGLAARGTRPANIADPSSAAKLTAVQVEIEPDDPAIQVFAHLEVYRTVEAARARGAASMESLKQRFDAGLDEGSVESFCVATQGGWTCAGSRQYVYAEVSLAPGSNANRALTTESLAALLRYADSMTRQATS